MSMLNSETEYELESGLNGASGATHESELLFNSLAAMADRNGRSQTLRRVALNAARAALRGATQPAPTIEGELELEYEQEYEYESSATTLSELEAELEHMAHAASEAATEQEAAEQFLPLVALASKLAVPLLKRAVPAIARAVTRNAPRALRRVAPSLSRGVTALTRTLHRNRSTRPLVRAIPRIASTTLQSIADRAARGQRITPRLAAQILARQTTRTLGNPRRLHRCWRHSVNADRRYHHRHGGASSPQVIRTGTYGGPGTVARRRRRRAIPSALPSASPVSLGRPASQYTNCRRVVICDNCASRL